MNTHHFFAFFVLCIAPTIIFVMSNQAASPTSIAFHDCVAAAYLTLRWCSQWGEVAVSFSLAQ